MATLLRLPTSPSCMSTTVRDVRQTTAWHCCRGSSARRRPAFVPVRNWAGLRAGMARKIGQAAAAAARMATLLLGGGKRWQELGIMGKSTSLYWARRQCDGSSGSARCGVRPTPPPPAAVAAARASTLPLPSVAASNRWRWRLPLQLLSSSSTNPSTTPCSTTKSKMKKLRWSLSWDPMQPWKMLWKRFGRRQERRLRWR
mmetsp:Transcript_9386/g.23090  ORF Transcript_9386/g.23090 Transcript_9386/m.23090 type:complete len:200 (+) Transcript_9386:638-1237(+)